MKHLLYVAFIAASVQASQESRAIIELKGEIEGETYSNKLLLVPKFTGAELKNVTIINCHIEAKKSILSLIGCSCILKSCMLEDSTLQLEDTTINGGNEPIRALGKSVVLSYGETTVVPGVTVEKSPDKKSVVSTPTEVCELVQRATAYIKPYDVKAAEKAKQEEQEKRNSRAAYPGFGWPH